MEKKRNLKNRIFAGLLAIALAGSTPVLASSEEQIIKEETQTELFELFKVDFDITDPEYEAYEHKYVSEDGAIEKWYISYLPEIDGLKRTDEKRLLSSTLWEDDSEYDFKGDYEYIYYNYMSGYTIPLHEQDKNILLNYIPHIKTKVITQISDEELQILLDYGVYRVIDSIIYFKTDLKSIKENGMVAMAYLKPLFIDEEGLHVDVFDIPLDSKGYNHETMNGLLIAPEANSLNESFYDLPEEEKKLVIKKK